MEYKFIKYNVSRREYLMYEFINNLGLKFVPKLYSYDKDNKILITQKINGISVSDMYGENINSVPINVVNEIHKIIKLLYYTYNIIYPDITGYNFIEDKNKKIWIIDFENAFYLSEIKKINDDDDDKLINHKKFVETFIEKKQIWNPYFN